MNECRQITKNTKTTTNSIISTKTVTKKHLILEKRIMSGNLEDCPSQNSSNGQEISAEDRLAIEERQRKAFAFFTNTLTIYSVEELIFCFNGGKDCTVLLDLLMRFLRQENISSGDIPMLYIKSGDSFAEIDDFVERCVRNYRVELVEYEGSLKEALTHMAADMPRIKAVFVGSRNTDPYCQHLAPMQPTDNDWPPMMRLNPLLEWGYHDVWHYIHMNSVPYCSLYDRGYTSIGNRSNTIPNPHLRRHDPQCDCDTNSECSCNPDGYRPAWELADPTQERAGRLPRK
ncbi:probable FAD synthase [Drosophila eugracilis]|uniref:probable FAD synthase n=1 Tax=Drosophila eugracilis TaxID=29029 RepID=UPI0007E60EB8|nr:probable FAD synthase [Drosophila eugracilis]XP_017065018.1 probable FAD synthase [Drosophila eugracilis]